jgi:hypothetical protein
MGCPPIAPPVAFKHDYAKGRFVIFQSWGIKGHRAYLTSKLSWVDDPSKAHFLKEPPPERLLRFGWRVGIVVELDHYRSVVEEVPPW